MSSFKLDISSFFIKAKCCKFLLSPYFLANLVSWEKIFTLYAEPLTNRLVNLMVKSLHYGFMNVNEREG